MTARRERRRAAHVDSSSPPKEIKMPIPGYEEIPADMPDSPHGDASLEYTLQNFNMLVAANTAMQTELSSMSGMMEEERVVAADLRTCLQDTRDANLSMRTSLKNLSEQISQLQGAEAGLKAEADYQRSLAVALQRRVDRAAGYLDRVLDQEASYEKAETIPAAKPAIGPDLDSIPTPRHDIDKLWPGESLSYLSPSEGRRRY